MSRATHDVQALSGEHMVVFTHGNVCYNVQWWFVYGYERQTMLPLSLELYHKNLLPLERILEMLIVNPAKLINENSRGSIEVGNIADLAIIDIDYEWIIDSSKMLSKSKNTPFNGRKVRGKNMVTIIGGEIVYCDEEWKKFCFVNSDVMN